MHKTELIRSLATATKYYKKNVEAVIDAFVATVVKTLKKGNEVNLIGFGKFTTVKRTARSGRNPSTGVALKIPARTVARFTPGSKLSKAVK